ncbi:MAG: hypothetical protein Tsb0034_15500 [Ekhidna sp.]
MKKTIIYIGVILLLLGANAWLFFGNNGSSSVSSQTYFSQEELTGISELEFNYENQKVKLTREADRWMLNDQYPADLGFVSTLLSVLERVEEARQIENWKGDQLGVLTIAKNDGTTLMINFGTNPSKTKSYFWDEGEVSEVIVPGYRDNVVDIFSMHPDQWRDRTLVQGSWRTIQKLEIDYRNKEEDLIIRFEDKFFLVNEQQPADSSAVVDYLNQFEHFMANEMVSEGRVKVLDSLAQLDPLATLTIDDIKYEKPLRFHIYPRSDQRNFHLLILGNGERAVVDGQRIANLLKNPADFGVTD